MFSTIAEAQAWARSQGVDRLDAQLLLAQMFAVDRAWLVTHDDRVLSETQRQTFARQVSERTQEVPLAYLLGEKEFHGLRLQVSPAVLVPRPDTETLVNWALEILQTLPAEPAPQVVDLGTGSGAIALAVKHGAPSVQMQMADLSPEALAVAKANANRLGLDVGAHLGSWWHALPIDQLFDLVLSNPPYIAGGDPHLPALRHEPTLALTPGGDGLSSLQAIIDGAPERMRPGAWLLLEHGYDQAGPVAAMLARAGFEAIANRRDLGDQPRVTGGRYPR
ncbi:MAG: peptide chain release factor N(5)-glutamine methyltransferase [Burkholderiaceae bacterium]|nr:peptide chain release factor N(5)-glutamine methyltransferase [Burkholderiaceae bacterium]